MYHWSCTSESKVEVISSLLLCGYVLSAKKTTKVLRSCSSSCNIFVLLPGARPSSTKAWYLQICAAYCERLSVNSINFYGFFSQNHFVAPPLSAGTLGRNPPTTNLINRETPFRIVGGSVGLRWHEPVSEALDRRLDEQSSCWWLGGRLPPKLHPGSAGNRCQQKNWKSISSFNHNFRPRILCCTDLCCWDPNLWKSRWHLRLKISGF